jgi:hypothetical protein
VTILSLLRGLLDIPPLTAAQLLERERTWGQGGPA